MKIVFKVQAIISVLLVIAIGVVASTDFFSGIVFGTIWTLAHLTILYLLKNDD